MRTICKIAVTFIGTLAISSAFAAKDINLYDQPEAKAKVIGNVDLSAGIIPILTPKDSDWIKVADPRNGNVGWIKSNEMNAGGVNNTVTFTQRVINNGQGPQTYQIIQYGGQKEKMNPKQVQNMVQRMQMQHQVVEESMHKAVQEMMKDMDNLYHYNWQAMNGTHFPMIMPVIIIPQSKTVSNSLQKPKISNVSSTDVKSKTGVDQKKQSS